MKKLLLFCSLLLSLLPLSLPAAAETFEKVTDVSTLKAGDKIIFVLNQGKVGSANSSYNGYMTNEKTSSLFKGKTEAATSAYNDIIELQTGSENSHPAVLTLVESGNESFPWLLKHNDTHYLKATGQEYVSSSNKGKNGLGEVLIANVADACQINFSNTENHSFNFNLTAPIANARRFLIANINNGKTGECGFTCGSTSSSAFKPDIYRLKASVPVDYTPDFPSTLTLAKDETYPFTLPTPIPSDFAWSTSDENVADVVDNELMALDYGEATITATWGKTDTNFNEGSATILVTVAKPEPIAYNPGFPESVNLVLGNKEKDFHIFKLKGNHPAINWAISNKEVVNWADNQENTIIASSKGTAVVKATWDADDYFLAGEASINVNVVEEIIAAFTPETITTSIDPAKGETATAKFEAVGSEEIAIDNFNFTSSDESIATYDPATGIVTLKAIGSATITATLTEEAAKEYIFADGVTNTLSISIADINGPIGYELVTSLDQITDEDYYVIVANYTSNGTSYHKAMSVTMGNNSFNPTDVTITDGLVNPTKETLILSAKKTEDGKYIWTTTNLEKNGNLQGNNTHGNNNIQCGSTGSTYSDLATVNFTKENELDMYFGAPTTVSKKLLYSISNSAFKNYATSNIGNSSYAQPSLYLLNFVKAEAPDYEEFEGKGVGDQVKFTARHSSHKLQYREWVLPKTLSRAEVEKQYLSDWKEAAGVTSHTHVIKNLDDVQDNIAAHGVEVRSIDSRGNVSGTVGFSYDGEKTVTGIESVAAEAEGEGELYNLQGVRVNRATAAPGLYIECRGGKAVKVIL